MKTLVTIISIALILGCNTPKDEKTEIITSVLSEEIKIDSLGLEKIFADSSLKSVNASEILELTQNLADTSLFSGLDDGFLRLDSIKKAGGYENYLSHLDIGMYKDIRAIHYKDLSIGDTKTVKLWGFDYSSYEACPYANGKVVFVSVFENGKNTACVPFCYFQNWADAPFYENLKTNSILDKDGNLTLTEHQINGGVDEKDKDYSSQGTSKLQLKLENGVFRRL